MVVPASTMMIECECHPTIYWFVALPQQSAVSTSTRMKSPVVPRQLKNTATASSSSSRRSPTAIPDDYEASRVRVCVRVRPRNQEEELCDAPDCIQLHPELNKLTLTKNNWNCESYRFDQVFTPTASQKRVYDVVARPVVESVLNGHNGTVMAYGQTGTGKTYTVGALGKEDPSQCGIMVRAMKHILSTPASASASASLTVHVSYLQLYLESLQDLLLPQNNNIPILEHPRTGQLSLPAAALIKVQDLDHFLQLLQIGDSNRHAANSKLNTQSSRSHAILMVHIRMSSQGKTQNHNDDTEMVFPISTAAPTLIKSKLLIVDLAGSERIHKSGSEGHMLDEAKFINLSLTSLGKCIHAIAENSPHIPTRDSKLTRLLRDSFGGSARTSLIITIGPSARDHAETSSTIMFGQRAMKIVNVLKLKEEFDYEGLCRKLENQVDYLTTELERQQKLSEDDRVELDRKLRECHNSFIVAEKTLATKSELLHKENTRLESEIKSVLVELQLQRDHNELMHDEIAKLEISLKQSKQSHLENSTYQKVLAETTQMYEKKITELIEELENKHAYSERVQEQLNEVNKILSDHQNSIQERYELHEKTVKECQSLRGENENLSLEKIQMKKKIDELEHKLQELGHLYENILNELVQSKSKSEKLLPEMDGYKIDRLRIELQEMRELYEKTINEFQSLQTEHNILLSRKETMSGELSTLERRLSIKEKERKYLEEVHTKLLKLGFENDGYPEDGRQNLNGIIGNVTSGLGSPRSLRNLQKPRETISSQRATVAKIINEVGLPNIISMLSSEDVEVQTHAVKVVANLAAEDKNQETIVEEGGLEALLMLLGSSTNATIHRVGSGAIANLAMNEINQGLIMSKGGARLLANIAFNSNDPQTLRMVAGAIANLCGNYKLHAMLRDDGGIKALFKMVQSGNNDVLAQVARGVANFAKCESRGTVYGHRKGKSLLLEDGTLTWLVRHSTSTSTSTRRHIELALCHLGQNEENAQDFIYSGALKELVRISYQSSREDIRSLAKKILKLNPTFQSEMHRI